MGRCSCVSGICFWLRTPIGRACAWWHAIRRPARRPRRRRRSAGVPKPASKGCRDPDGRDGFIQNSASNLTGHWYGFACGYFRRIREQAFLRPDGAFRCHRVPVVDAGTPLGTGSPGRQERELTRLFHQRPTSTGFPRTRAAIRPPMRASRLSSTAAYPPDWGCDYACRRNQPPTLAEH